MKENSAVKKIELVKNFLRIIHTCNFVWRFENALEAVECVFKLSSFDKRLYPTNVLIVKLILDSSS
jgi:hypothetical protein